MSESKKLGASLGWKLLESEVLDESLFSKVYRDKIDCDGRKITYTYLKSPGAVFVVPVTEEGKFVLIKNYRWTVDEACWEVPAGIVADRKDMPFDAIAKDEMYEEAGCVGGEFHSLGKVFSANGIVNITLHLFLAVNVKRVKSAPEAGEKILEVKEVTRAELETMLDTNQISDGDSVMILLLALRKLSCL